MHKYESMEQNIKVSHSAESRERKKAAFINNRSLDY